MIHSPTPFGDKGDGMKGGGRRISDQTSYCKKRHGLVEKRHVEENFG